MKSKFFILSVILHIAVFMGFSKLPENQLKKGEITPNINVSLTMSNMGNSSKTLPKMTTKKEVEKKTEIKKKKPKKQVVQKKKVKPKKKIVQEKKKITNSKPKIVQSQKTEPEKIVTPTDPIETETEIESNTDIDTNPTEVEVTQDIPINDAILGDEENDKNLVEMKNGQYALKNQRVTGINYVISKEVPPAYPEFARKMGYNKETLVKVKFLVDIKGKITDIKFYTTSKFGFEDEVEKALKQWIFKPIIYQNKPMPVYFYKVIRFNLDN